MNTMSVNNMTRNEATNIVKKKCGKAKGYEDPTFIQDEEYSLADVLLAIEQCNKYPSAMDKYSAYGTIAFYHWNLRSDSLTEQSDETLVFLAELLK